SSLNDVRRASSTVHLLVRAAASPPKDMTRQSPGRYTALIDPSCEPKGRPEDARREAVVASTQRKERPMRTPSPRRPPALLGAGLAIAGAGAAFAVASPASASTGTQVCVKFNGQEICIYVPYAINLKDWLCGGCPELTFESNDLVINPEVSRAVANEVAQ